LSAATTSCNPGSVPVRWQLETVNGPLIEEHPFIGLALYRLDVNGRLEMIGKNWIKHGFFATNANDCLYGCTAAPNSLGVGCADTYAVGHNGATLYLGPREEVNPHTGDWTACGSYFDGTPVDCKRNFMGVPSEVDHRLEAWDEDLGLSGARYFYEGVYYVQGDENIDNNIGWKECTVTWANLWVFSDINSTPGWAQKDTDGALIATWGDQQAAVPAAADDGTLWFAVKVDSLGGGEWHYEYAVYNYTSNRGLFSFAVPTGTANVTNVGFHDVDHDSSTDWTPVIGPGLVTWSTDDWATDPAAPALGYQSLFNFRFDADAPPVVSDVLGGLFLPGIGTNVSASLLAPAAASTAVLPEAAGRSSFGLLGVEPNPARGGARVSFSLDRDRDVRLSVVDVSGRTLRVLREGAVPAGQASAVWDGLDANGARAAAGVYFFRLESDGASRTRKVTLLR
ncbi:MAG: FlgD immunoglobulin-like domain containing protein, partial [Candidatus Eiseniibacteriota bacterium]